VTITLEGPLADLNAWMPTRCPAARALEAIGPPSSLLVIREAFYGTSRFDDFVRRLGMTESAVTARLRHLVDAGVLAKEPYREPGQRTRYAYRLTPMGRDLLPILVSLMKWGDTYLQEPVLSVTHADCGEPVVVETRCTAGHPVTEEEVVVRPARKR
jgi:DNA-binding HxlR family transcriptional regulator